MVAGWAEAVRGIPSRIREKQNAAISHVLDPGSAFDRYPELRFP